MGKFFHFRAQFLCPLRYLDIQIFVEALDLSLYSDETTSALLQSGEVLESDELFDRADSVMALGGDGTMLRVARELNGRDKPVMGVNIGSLGFLTSVAEGDLERGLECLAREDVSINGRAVAEVALERNGKTIAQHRGLNDIVISRGPSSRVVTLDVFVDKDKGTSYVCDGLIVSTPTGSTGHSLSAGGPILSPGTEAFVISLICPHSLSSRPLVLPDRSEILVNIADSVGELLLCVDGQVDEALVQGDSIRVCRSEKDVIFAHLPGYSYYSVLRQKLGWSGKSV